MLTFKTLQRRFIFLLLVPVTLFLLGLGVLGYRFIKDLLFTEWRQVAVLRLERAANHVDKRLDELRLWLQAFARAGQNPHAPEIQAWILAQLQAQPGVSQVKLTWLEPGASAPARSAKLSPLHFSYPPDEKNAVMAGEIVDRTGNTVGRLEVLVSYDYLLQDILAEGWLQTQMACLVSSEGIYLAHTTRPSAPDIAWGKPMIPWSRTCSRP